MLRNKLRQKKLDLSNGLNKFFNDFSDTNRLIFAKLKDSINTRQNILVDSLSDIKRKIKLFYNEEEIYRNATSYTNKPQNANMNLRKKNIIKEIKDIKGNK